jgi:hypothetical protein
MKKLEYDVAVIGGGPAGTVAAIAAAENGAKTILIEQNGYLGGAMTSCGTGPQMTYHAGKVQVIRGIPQRMEEEMIRRGFSTGHIPDAVGFCSSTTAFDPEGMKLVWEDMALKAGVTLLYHTVFTGCTVKDGTITEALLYAKGGFMSLSAKVFVDASADADVATAAGVTSVYGRESDHLAQPMTMNFHVYGVDREKLCAYVSGNRSDMYKGTRADLHNSKRYDISGAFSKINAAKQAGEFHVDRDTVLCFETNTDGEYVVNMTRISRLSAVDPFDLTKAEIEGRKQVRETYLFLKKYIPGFENCHIAYSGPSIGIRESRKIDGIYKFTGEDLISNRMFKDAVVMGGYPIDIHSPDGGNTEHKMLKPGSWYSVPYRSLIAETPDNLIVAGRCLSATQEACAAVRVTPIVMGIGQAAGTAASLAAEQGCAVQKLDTELLREKLRQGGAFLEEYRA